MAVERHTAKTVFIRDEFAALVFGGTKIETLRSLPPFYTSASGDQSGLCPGAHSSALPDPGRLGSCGSLQCTDSLADPSSRVTLSGKFYLVFLKGGGEQCLAFGDTHSVFNHSP